jgi:hypothetical protein
MAAWIDWHLPALRCTMTCPKARYCIHCSLQLVLHARKGRAIGSTRLCAMANCRSLEPGAWAACPLATATSKGQPGSSEDLYNHQAGSMRICLK